MDSLALDISTLLRRSAPPPPSPLANTTSPTLSCHTAAPPIAHPGAPGNELSTSNFYHANLVPCDRSRRSSSATLRGGGAPSSLPSTSRAVSHPHPSTTSSPTTPHRPFDLTLPGVPVDNRPRTTDKACRSCRHRKVRCGREYPSCKRCRKRREECIYPPEANLEEIEIEPQADFQRARIELLESKLASLESLLGQPGSKYLTRGSEKSGPSHASASTPTSPSLPHTTFPSDLFAAVASALRSNYGQEKARLVSFLSTGHDGYRGLSSHDLGLRMISVLLDDFTTRYKGPYLTPCQWSWEIVAPLDLHRPPLDDASRRGFDLDITTQIALCVLCVFGARYASSSRLLQAITGNDTAAFSMGKIRDCVCNTLVEYAWASSNGLAARGLGSTVAERQRSTKAYAGLVNILGLEDAEARRARAVLSDLLAVGGLSEEQPAEVTNLLHEMDGSMAAMLSLLPLISTSHLSVLFDTPGLLQAFLDSLNLIYTVRTVSLAELDHAIGAASSWTCVCERRFGIISTEEYSSMVDLDAMRALLSTVDRLHYAFRRLVASLPSLTVLSATNAGGPFNSEIFSLTLICIDIRVSGLFSLIHRYLLRKSARPEWKQLVAESEQHVRRCIRLFASYTQILSLSDRIELVHFFIKFSHLPPDWTTMALQQVGDVPGPASIESAVSSDELYWLSAGLLRASAYTTRVHPHLENLASGHLHQLPIRRHSSFPSGSHNTACASTFTPAFHYEPRVYASGPSSPQVGTSQTSGASFIDFQQYRSGDRVGVSDDSAAYTSRESSLFGQSPSPFASSFGSRSDAFPENFTVNDSFSDGDVSALESWETTSLPLATQQESFDNDAENLGLGLVGAQETYFGTGNWHE